GVWGRGRMAVVEVVGDDGRVGEREPGARQDRCLALGGRGERLGVLRRVSPRAAERHRDDLVREPLLAERDAHLAGEETERTRVELHALASFAGTGSPECPQVGATYREDVSQYALLATRLPPSEHPIHLRLRERVAEEARVAALAQQLLGDPPRERERRAHLAGSDACA